MNTVTHALMPVLLAKTGIGKEMQPKRWQWLALMLAGAMPDLINPHIYLESRMTSWSHGLPAWLAFCALLLLVSIAFRGRINKSLMLMLSVAYLLHIFCDGISGGVNLLHPVTKWIWGDYWVGLVWWIPIDIVLLLSCYYLFRLKPMFAASRARRAELASSQSLHMGD